MKSLLVTTILLFSASALATVDVNTNITILIKHNNNESGFELNQVPADFCVGIPSLTLGTAMTQPVTITAGYGCGMAPQSLQINLLTCAKIEAEEVANDDGSYNWRKVKVAADVSNCGELLYDESFGYYVEQAVYKTWNDHGLQIVDFTLIQ